MTTTGGVVASPEAYTKALLHCYKYPTQPVLGMLVGKRLGDGAATAVSAGGSDGSSHATGERQAVDAGAVSSGGGYSCYVMDAVPLFHAQALCTPSPAQEVAYIHVQSTAKAAGQTLLGIYVANDRLDDRSITPAVRRVVEKLQSRLPSPAKLLVWFIHNDRLTSPPTDLAVTSLFADSSIVEKAVPLPEQAPAEGQLSFGRWNSDMLQPATTVSEEAATEMVTNALDAFAQHRIVDLEDHLEDPMLNYLDQPLSSLEKRRSV